MHAHIRCICVYEDTSKMLVSAKRTGGAQDIGTLTGAWGNFMFEVMHF